MTEKMSDFKDILRSHNLRPTQQRVNLGKLLFGKLDRHITAEILKQESDYENLIVLAFLQKSILMMIKLGMIQMFNIIIIFF